MNRREASKKETRQLILTAARRLFAQRGMEEATIRDIAKEAGVSPASVVVHFKSKTALLEEALSMDVEKTMATVVASMPEAQPLLDRLMHLAGGFFEFYDQNRDLFRALIRSTIFEPVSETPHISSLSVRYIGFLYGLMAEEKAQGLIRPEVDAYVAAAAVYCLYLGAIIVLFRQPEMSVAAIAEMLRAMTGQYLEGIVIRESKH